MVLASVWAVNVVAVAAVAVVHAAISGVVSASNSATSCTRTTSVPLNVTSSPSTATAVNWLSAFDSIPLSALVLWTDSLYARTRTLLW